MKVMTLKLGDKIYTTIKVTAYMAKEAMRINRDAVALGKFGNELRDDGKKSSDAEKLDSADKMFDALLEISERKTALICEGPTGISSLLMSSKKPYPRLKLTLKSTKF